MSKKKLAKKAAVALANLNDAGLTIERHPGCGNCFVVKKDGAFLFYVDTRARNKPIVDTE